MAGVKGKGRGKDERGEQAEVVDRDSHSIGLRQGEAVDFEMDLWFCRRNHGWDDLELLGQYFQPRLPEHGRRRCPLLHMPPFM